MIEKYKMECYANSGDLAYLNGSFEVYFEGRDSMLDFVDQIPESYTTKHYKKNENDEWDIIGPSY